ncbi:hypothetical protein K5V21_01240 [Clostridium sardiniense]|uniref:DUF1097 domain-containing protein n=1 Tax=Clostridium sardiniense TaxID=29369 RepID=A0ABS7KTL3_CLOSR|nr:hypothetical protein [Clostridium sardiniense]MBY0754069.1 hypothetical protein [Clostridium sardiniense]MDQ0459410.1 LytS/YehU family sensor histidine kinase [Clostridium sardiniense]
MKNYIVGIIVGLLGGMVNILFLLFAPDIDISVYVSTFITWTIIGLLISSSNFKLNGFLKGSLIAVMLSLPSIVYTISFSVFGAIWTLINSIIIGAIMGFVIENVQKKFNQNNRNM